MSLCGRPLVAVQPCRGPSSPALALARCAGGRAAAAASPAGRRRKVEKGWRRYVCMAAAWRWLAERTRTRARVAVIVAAVAAAAGAQECVRGWAAMLQGWLLAVGPGGDYEIMARTRCRGHGKDHRGERDHGQRCMPSVVAAMGGIAEVSEIMVSGVAAMAGIAEVSKITEVSKLAAADSACAASPVGEASPAVHDGCPKFRDSCPEFRDSRPKFRDGRTHAHARSHARTQAHALPLQVAVIIASCGPRT